LVYSEAHHLERDRGYTGAREHVIGFWIVLALVQVAILLPAWRCFCLRRWGAGTVLCLAWIGFLPALSFCLPFLREWSLAIAIVPLISTFIISNEWPNLKSGF
jgi:hypothetical protein